MDYQEYLCHFNENHDPRTGQFAPKKGVVGALQKLGYRQAHSKSGQAGMRIAKNGFGRTVKDNLKSKRGKSVLMVAGSAAAGVALVGTVRLAKQRKALEWLSDGNFTIPISSRIASTAKLAGKRALQAGLATYGAIKVNDYINKRPKSESTICNTSNQKPR